MWQCFCFFRFFVWLFFLQEQILTPQCAGLPWNSDTCQGMSRGTFAFAAQMLAVIDPISILKTEGSITFWDLSPRHFFFFYHPVHQPARPHHYPQTSLFSRCICEINQTKLRWRGWWINANISNYDTNTAVVVSVLPVDMYQNSGIDTPTSHHTHLFNFTFYSSWCFWRAEPPPQENKKTKSCLSLTSSSLTSLFELNSFMRSDCPPVFHRSVQVHNLSLTRTHTK